MESVASSVADFTDTISRSLLAMALTEVLSQPEMNSDNKAESLLDVVQTLESVDAADIHDDKSGNPAPDVFREEIKMYCNSHAQLLTVKSVDSEYSFQKDNEMSEFDDTISDACDDRRDWLNEFRRRSSNLSDNSSRRSSHDTRNSSEFSSEFEEFFGDGFERNFDRKIYKTIKEEGSRSAGVAEFATKLASLILSDGPKTAATLSQGVQMFIQKPSSGCLHKPKPVRASRYGANPFLVSTPAAHLPPINTSAVHSFVDRLFDQVYASIMTESSAFMLEKSNYELLMKYGMKRAKYVKFADILYRSIWSDVFGCEPASHHYSDVLYTVNSLYNAEELKGVQSSFHCDNWQKIESLTEHLLGSVSSTDTNKEALDTDSIAIVTEPCGMFGQATEEEVLQKDTDVPAVGISLITDSSMMQPSQLSSSGSQESHLYFLKKYLSDVSSVVVKKSLMSTDSPMQTDFWQRDFCLRHNSARAVIDNVFTSTLKELGVDYPQSKDSCVHAPEVFTPDAPPPTPSSPFLRYTKDVSHEKKFASILCENIFINSISEVQNEDEAEKDRSSTVGENLEQLDEVREKVEKSTAFSIPVSNDESKISSVGAVSINIKYQEVSEPGDTMQNQDLSKVADSSNIVADTEVCNKTCVLCECDSHACKYYKSQQDTSKMDNNFTTGVPVSKEDSMYWSAEKLATDVTSQVLGSISPKINLEADIDKFASNVTHNVFHSVPDNVFEVMHNSKSTGMPERVSMEILHSVFRQLPREFHCNYIVERSIKEALEAVKRQEIIGRVAKDMVKVALKDALMVWS